MYTMQGKVIVNVYPPSTDVYRWDYEPDQWDGRGADYINDGMGWDWFLDPVEEITKEGRYLIVFEVTYHPGNFYDEADEDYVIESVELVAVDFTL